MSDTSQGPGWWLAADGKWYAPDSELQVAPGWTQGAEGEWVAPGNTGDGALPGWWIGTDGTWYTPSIHPQPPEPLPAPDPTVDAAAEGGPVSAESASGTSSSDEASAPIVASSAWKTAFVPAPAGSAVGSTPSQNQPRPIPASSPSAPNRASYVPPYRRANPCAVVSLVFGLVIPIPLGSIIFGIIALVQIDESNGRERGKALAIWGIILGAIQVIGLVILAAVLVKASSCDSSVQSC